MRDAHKIFCIAKQKFAAPNCAVRSVPRTVPHHAQRAVGLILRKTRGKVGVVVLDSFKFQVRGFKLAACNLKLGT